MRTVLAFCFLLFAANVALGQLEPVGPDIFPRRVIAPAVPGQPRAENPIQYRIPGKKASQYTPEDWGTLIDSTWGPGQPAAEQLQIFDTFWGLIRQQWAGFPNLALNCSYWDSVANVYRPQIGSGLSRGRFYALMSRMWLALSEHHTWIYDLNVDTTFGYSTFNYRPGVPLLCVGPYLGNMLGAAVTPLADSTNLVYRVATGNPLGLVPGDLVIGYDGIPWKRLYRQLLDAGLPVSYWYSWNGSTPESMTHFFLMAVGLNWGLFDTIDVVKFSSGDTLHMPTALLDTTLQTVWQSDQVPVPGVPMPQAPGSAVAVSWGVVQGTNIGYIYVWDWASTQTQQLWQNAVNDLVHVRRVTGLVLDFRMNWGGNFPSGNGGLSQLFNFDPTSNLRTAFRNSASDCMSFSLGSPPSPITPGTIYDHPIAVLIGPGAFSVGDFNALRMRFHPMARLFGKPTDGAFVAGYAITGSLSGGWQYNLPTAMVYSNVPGEGYMMHKGVQPDEELWLTREGVANGQDAVVNRALAWMNTLSYAHDVVVSVDAVATTPAAQGMMYAASDTLYTIDTQTGAPTRIGWIGPYPMQGLAIRPSTGVMYGVSTTSGTTSLYCVSASAVTGPTLGRLTDSVRITSKVENPGQHTLAVSAIITNTQGLMIDSVLFSKAAGDSLWRASVGVPPVVGKYDVSVRTEDLTSGSYRRLPNVAWFSISLGRVQRTLPVPDIRAIAFNQGDTLFGATTNGMLYRIDLSTGNADLVGTTARLAYSGLSFRPRLGQLWASVRTPIDSIFVLNTTSGAATFVGVTGFGAITSSIVFDAGGNLLALIDNGSGECYLAALDTITAAGSIVAGPLLVRNLKSIAIRTDSLGSVSVRDQHAGAIPLTFALQQNYPNPFNPTTTLQFTIVDRQLTIVKVYDVLGQEVATLVNEEKDPGTYTVTVDGRSLASGVYFYQLRAGDFMQTRAMMVLK